MQKRASRAIPYRVYKSFFRDCPAHDYENGKIVVDFPADYLESSFSPSAEWDKSPASCFRKYGNDRMGRSVHAQIIERHDVIAYYEAFVYSFSGYTSKEFRSFQAAAAWADATAAEHIA